MYQTRISKLCQALKSQNVDYQLISDPASINYLTGYKTDPGERLLLLILAADGHLTLVLNQLFPPAQVDPKIEQLIYSDGQPILKKIAALLSNGKQVGIDKTWPSHFLLDLMTLKSDLLPLNNSAIIDDLRAIKSPEEIEIMKKASALNDQAVEFLISQVDQGLAETEMVKRLNDFYKKTGHSGLSFEPIVAYGANGADPHHTSSDSLPKIGDSVVLDIGGIYQGYASDMTRTVFYGQASPEAVKVYETVLAANLAALNQVKPGVPLKTIDLAARKIIEDAGYGPYFTHRTGHFIGQECHEAGDVGPYNETLTQVGNVFSIEPGIYLPNKLGVRIEDLVVVTEDGYELLNHANKELQIIPIDKKQ